jgi:hypothetical protein
MLIQGTVRDDAGHPVASARIIIADAPGPVPDIAALTAADGTFVLSVGMSGQYLVECHAEGFAPATAEVSTVAGADPVPVTLILRPAVGG